MPAVHAAMHDHVGEQQIERRAAVGDGLPLTVIQLVGRTPEWIARGAKLAEEAGADIIDWFAEEGKRIYGAVIPTTIKDLRYVVLKQPIGVCAAITPWNFPAAMITRKVAPALAAGCPVVIKPAELTPLTALAAAELAIRAGIPAGVLNILTADSDNSIAVGKVFCASDTVRHISFTGSTEVGRILMAQSAPLVFFECLASTPAQLASYKSCMTMLSQVGYSAFWVFDNYGNPMFCASMPEQVCQMLDYIWRQAAHGATRSMYYVDVLAVSPNDEALAAQIVADYIKATCP